MSMLIGHSRPSPITWSISGTGATSPGPLSNLDDGRPDTLSVFTWDTGAQSLATVFRLRGDWTTGAIVPRVIGLSNLLLPVGTKIACAFRRAGDPGGTYPYVPPMYAASTRLFSGPRGERTAWLLPKPGATEVIGCEIQISNDVNGAASILPGTPFQNGEAVIAAGDDIDIDDDWTPGTVDSTMQKWQWSEQPYPSPGTVYRQLSFKLLADDDTLYFGDPANPSALDYDVLFAKLDRGKSAVYIPRYIDDSGAFSSQLLHRTALIGVATKIPQPHHLSGPVFNSSVITVQEAPIPT